MSSSAVSVSSSTAPPGTTFADVACFITHLPSSNAASQALHIELPARGPH